VFPRQMSLLAPCLHMLPKKKAAPGAPGAAAAPAGDKAAPAPGAVAGSATQWGPGRPRNPENYILKDQVRSY